MVDFLSRYRMYGLGYTSPKKLTPAVSYKELYRNHAPHALKAQKPLVHDCREPVVLDYKDSKLWEASLLSKGLRQTYRSVQEIHQQEKMEDEKGKKKPQKLLFNIGRRGHGKNCLSYPRGLTIKEDTDIIIADTMNHRIQIYNNFGVVKNTFGSLGKGYGEFNEPTGVTAFPNDTIAVADKKNKRIQVFTSDGKFKYTFNTVDEPFCVDCDHEYNLVVSTSARTIEIYRRGGKLVRRFGIGGPAPSKQSAAGCPVYICVNDNQEVVVSDTPNRCIKIFDYFGSSLYSFRPDGNGEALSMVPTGISMNPLGQIVVCDALNHTVNLYSERGILLLQLVGPPDSTGSVQTCAIGPEGHLVVTEFSANGEHCLKIFRYRDCECHRRRPGSSKRESAALYQ